MSRKYILVSITIFLVLLGAIPLLASNDLFLAAKIVGVVTVVSVSIAIRVWTKKSRKSAMHPDRIIMTRNDEFWLNVAVPFFKSDEKQQNNF